MPAFEVFVSKMQHIISNNVMTNSREEGAPAFDGITHRFLQHIFATLRPKDAIVITGSCIVAYTLEKQGLSSFFPGDIDLFVKENLTLEHAIFDRSFLIFNVLAPLENEGIHWQPKNIQVTNGLHPAFKKYGNCKIDIVHIIKFSLFRNNPAANCPKIQIIVVADNSPIPESLPTFGMTPFERKVITSFDIDIVQGAYNPNRSCITFAYSDTEENIEKMEFWYICNVMRPFRLSSTFFCNPAYPKIH
jgi:hypothetical protein